jgi:hypothetical protein
LRKLKVLRREYKEIRNEYKDDINSKVKQEASNEVYSSEMIADKLKELVEDNELVFQVIDILKGGCVYCEFIPVDRGA